MAKTEGISLTPEQQAQGDKQAVIEALRKVILDPKSKVLDKTRAAETLGRLAEYSWYAKPSDPQQPDAGIDNRTAQRICELYGRMLKEGLCAECGKALASSQKSRARMPQDASLVIG